MKRLALILAVAAMCLLIIAVGCKKPPPAPPEQPKIETPVETKPTEPEKPAVVEEKPMIQESQFQTVYFDFDKYNLRTDAKAALDANAALLKQFPDVIVRIEGHCDERGTVEYNLSLGERRARSTMEYLAGLGIDAGRLSIVSYGEERPAVQGSDEGAWSKNRRAEFRIISK
ncbi:MAG: peptidoglycan-associated lipoprotein Pal [candidate division Zixibacteria bacterium]|nr:peptidoglycan-associated lipoprotein Pal [candidate division Zixibacteria bacterium]